MTDLPTSHIEHADGLLWLRDHPAEAHDGVITSLPDLSEVPLAFEAWREWFMRAARDVLTWIPAVVNHLPGKNAGRFEGVVRWQASAV
jgi:hypothetical protein